MKRAAEDTPSTDLTAARPTKKVKTCTACQTRKIKCNLPPDRSACARCSRLGLQCHVQKDLQSLLEEDVVWKAAQNDRSSRLEHAVDTVLKQLGLPPLSSMSEHASPLMSQSDQYGGSSLMGRTPPTHATPYQGEQFNSSLYASGMTRENSQDPEQTPATEEQSTVTQPMSSMFEVTKLRNIRSNLHNRPQQRTSSSKDFIDLNILPLDVVEALFESFSKSLNHYLWSGIALPYTTLAETRAASTLLMTAILTVTALHLPGHEAIFDTCYAIFLDLVASSFLARYHSLDDIRGLCVGAFWLSDLSWKLSGHAVRIGMEMHLHLSPARALTSESSESRERARLWYFLYICDHHFSIAYGRPPIIQEDALLSLHKDFLASPEANESDFRVHSQIGVFLILSRVQKAFGLDEGEVLSRKEFVVLRQFNSDLDRWRQEWESRLAPNHQLGDYPARGVVLHYHFAKLQVNALALRGIQAEATISPDRRTFVDTAFSSAIEALRVIVFDPVLSSSVVGVPLYLHTTISSSVVFLFRLCTRNPQLTIPHGFQDVEGLIQRVILVLSAAKASDRHLTSHMARGLQKLLTKLQAWRTLQERLAVGGLSAKEAPTDTTPSAQVMPVDDYLSNEVDVFSFDSMYLPIDFFDNLTAQYPLLQS